MVYHSGMEVAPDNPFQPGAGLFPPLRAGHERAAAFLAWRLRQTLDGNSGDIVVLHGPRGNGKTVLLSELRRQAGADVRQHSLTTGMMAGDQDVIARELAPKGFTMRDVKGVGIGFGGAKAEVGFQKSVGMTPWQALRATLGEEPVLLAIDEAHEMPVKFGQDLLQATQDCVAIGLRLLVVLAGTPGLRAHLGKMHASFWERCQKLRIGRLETVDAVKAALTEPAARRGMSFNGDALALLVGESQRYPNTV